MIHAQAKNNRHSVAVRKYLTRLRNSIDLTTPKSARYVGAFLIAPIILSEGVTTLAKGRVTTEQLKSDPLMDQYIKTTGWVQQRSRPLMSYLTVAAVVIAVALIAWLLFSRRATNAAESLAEAFRVNEALVQNPIPPNVQGYAFTTQDEKHRKAYEAFTKAANDYSSYNGDLGRYYAATHQLYFEPEKAEATLKELAQKDSPVGIQARMALAGRYEASGKNDEAVAEYNKLKDKPGELSPFLIKLKIARAYEAAGKNKEAADLYFEIASDKDIRSTTVGNEAVTRLTVLDPERVEKLPAPEAKSGMPISVN
jgi:tetratricopeptide (TPR) repeat protein